MHEGARGGSARCIMNGRRATLRRYNLDMQALDNVRIVLIETSHPGNIGGAARALHTMGLGQLVLVNPLRYPDPQADWRAAGGTELLRRARVVASS